MKVLGRRGRMKAVAGTLGIVEICISGIGKAEKCVAEGL
jgi:hypothetical protein